MNSFAEIFAFEVGTALRRPATWLYFAVFFLGGVLCVGGYDRAAGAHYNSPGNVAAYTLLVGFVGLLATASLFGDAASRDADSGMHPLFYTLSMSRGAYLGGRFAGAFVVNALVLLAIPLGLIAGTRTGMMPAEFLGPFRPAAYVAPLFVFVLPNLLVNGAFLFGLALLSRRSLPGYLGAIALFLLYVLAFSAAAATMGSAPAPYLDASGLIAAEGIISGWTQVERNTRMVPLRDALLWNRVLWLLIGAGIIAFTWSRFRFAHPAEGGRRGAAAAEEESPERAVPVRVPAAPRSFGARAQLRQMVLVASASFRGVARSRDFLVVLAGAVFFILAFGGEMMENDRFGVPSWPLTGTMIGFLCSFFVGLIVSLLIAFYAGELIWRERDARTHEITDAAPVPDWVPFAGKFIALTLLIATLQAVLTATGIVMQLSRAFYDIDLWLYARSMFGLQMADYLLLGVLAMFIHALVHHKYVGHLLVVLFVICSTFPGLLGIQHKMLVYNGDPGWMYSDMNGFGPFIGPFAWFKLYWAAWALLLAVAASLLWVRGTEAGPRGRMRLARRRFTRPMALGTATAAVLILSLGGFVFYNTNVRNEYRTIFREQDGQAEYERRYKRFEYVPQPSVARARLHVELHPERGSAETRGTYVLVNRTASAIDSVHVTVVPIVEAKSIRFSRAARRRVNDAEHGYWIYALAQPLAPGDSLRMDFDLAYAPRGFTNDRMRTTVVRNGTFLHQRWMPSIGYQRDSELPAADARRRHGLPPRPFRPSLYDERARRVARSSSDAGWIELETTVGTDAGQIAVAPGTLRREWRSGRRRYFHYRTDAPVLDFYAIFSAAYEVHTEMWNGIRLEVLFHPGHRFNRDRMLRSARAALAYGTRNFGPYPHRQLRLVEFPRYQSFARAYPGMIVFSEAVGPTTRVERGPGIDSPFLVTAHEVGHQWWGHQIMGADVQGSQMLSETLAQYTAMMVMETELGTGWVPAFLETMQIEYANRRGTHGNPEEPLMLTEDHDHIHYRKGAVVMYALRDYIGEERINAALANMIRRHAFQGPPFPTTLDLYRELEAVTPDSMRSMLHDLVRTITLWDMRAMGARARLSGDGAYRVQVDVRVRKLRADSVGNDTEIPMHDLVDIGVFGAPDAANPRGVPLYLAKHRLRTGQQTVTVTVRGRPERAGIDPYHKLLTRNKEEMDEKLAEVVIGR